MCWNGRVHTTPQEFENGVFTVKTYQKFSALYTPEEFENATITDHFGFVSERKNRSGKSRGYRLGPSFSAKSVPWK